MIYISIYIKCHTYYIIKFFGKLRKCSINFNFKICHFDVCRAVRKLWNQISMNIHFYRDFWNFHIFCVSWNSKMNFRWNSTGNKKFMKISKITRKMNIHRNLIPKLACCPSNFKATYYLIENNATLPKFSKKLYVLICVTFIIKRCKIWYISIHIKYQKYWSVNCFGKLRIFDILS